MQITMTIDDGLASRVAPHLGPLQAYVQARVVAWLEEIAPALDEQARQRLLLAYLDAPEGVQDQVEDLLRPYAPPPPGPPPDRTEE